MQIAPPPDKNFLQPLTSRIIEGRLITPYDYRAVAIPLYTTLSGTSPIGSATYNIPTNMRLRVRQIIPHIAMINPGASTETFAGGSAVMDNGDASDRLLLKAMNCRITLNFQSRAYDVMPQLSFPLSDLMSFNGEEASFLDMPGPVLQGTTLDLNAGLIDPNAAFSETEYGVLLIGAFIRVE